jgi:hypothetical protein
MKHHGGFTNNGVFDTVIVQRFDARAEILRGAPVPVTGCC